MKLSEEHFCFCYVHSGCIPLQLPDGKHSLEDGPIKWYLGLQTNETDSPVQKREPIICPFDRLPGDPQFTKTWRETKY